MPLPSTTTVLVSGATGYVGSWVVKTLLDRGYKVRGTVRSLQKKDKIAHLQAWIDSGASLDLVEADLLKPETWPPAVAGCDYVCHVASPFVMGVSSDDEDQLIKPAVEGTLNVLKPCLINESVKKAVVVSSIVSVMAGRDKKFEGVVEDPETHWSNPDKAEPYPKSKTLAEKAAWDLVQSKEGGTLDLAVINPSLVMGPTLSANSGTSIDICKKVLTGQMGLTPYLCLNVVDVRDVAEAIVRAMEKPEATGERFVTNEKGIWLNDLAQAARPVFRPLGYNPPHYNAPSFALKAASWVVPSLRSTAADLGRHYELSNTKIKTLLGMKFRPYQESFVDMCHSLIEHEIVGKTDKYKKWEEENKPGSS